MAGKVVLTPLGLLTIIAFLAISVCLPTYAWASHAAGVSEVAHVALETRFLAAEENAHRASALGPAVLDQAREDAMKANTKAAAALAANARNDQDEL